MRNNFDCVTAVVVTYGKRWCYLSSVLDVLEQEKIIKDIVVVDNASPYNCKEACQVYEKVIIISHDKNLGSAGGFCAGIEKALTMHSEYLMLFDDDTTTCVGVIPGLLTRLKDAERESPNILNAVIPYRESQHLALKSKKALKFFLENESVIGLNVFNFFHRHARKLIPVMASQDDYGSRYDYGLAAYGGLMLSRKVCLEIGLPNRDFVLYYDDIEYTNRIISNGGKVWLCMDLIMSDVDKNYSGNMMSRPFLGLVFADSEAKVYYQLRNQIYFESEYRSRNKLFFLTNVLVFFSIISLVSLLSLRFERFNTVRAAICDGLKSKLGANDVFKLG